MKILLVNVNTTEEATEQMVAVARSVASADTQVVGLTPAFGAAGVDSTWESLLAGVAVMDRVLTYEGEYDAVVVGGFGEHGREGLQDLLEVPVVDVAEAAAHLAMMLGHQYSVVTTAARSVAAVEDRLLLAGLSAKCASVRATGIATRELDEDPAAALAAIRREARAAIDEDGAEVICLGCGGMAGWEQELSAELGVPVIDGVAAAVGLAETLVHLGLSTSKVRTHAPPGDTPVRGWPLTRHLTIRREEPAAGKETHHG